MFTTSCRVRSNDVLFSQWPDICYADSGQWFSIRSLDPADQRDRLDETDLNFVNKYTDQGFRTQKINHERVFLEANGES